MNEVHKEFRNMKTEMSKINTQRGGGPSGLKGFYAESANATYDNIRRIEDGIQARQIVIDNNGAADAVIRYANGQLGRKIQYKNGYQYSKHKEFLSSGKYDNMIYAVNADNLVFSNPKQLENLKEIAKEHNIKVVPASVSDKEMKILADITTFEGNIRSQIGIDSAPKLTLELYVDAKEAAYHVEKVIEKQKAINVYIANETSSFLSEDLARINNAGMSQTLSAAQFATVLSVTRNIISMLNDEEKFDEATRGVVKDVVIATITGYATGAAAEKMRFSNMEDAALLVNSTLQISKQICSYVNDHIDEKQLLQKITETSTYLTLAYVGRAIGDTIGAAGGPVGTLVGQFVGEMITTAICSTIIDTIHKEQAMNQYNKKMLALAHRAEREIKESQDRLVIINEENIKFIKELNDGYNRFIDGLLSNNYGEVSSGLVTIGTGFGIEAGKLTQGKVKQGNIFGKKNRVIELG